MGLVLAFDRGPIGGTRWLVGAPRPGHRHRVPRPRPSPEGERVGTRSLDGVREGVSPAVGTRSGRGGTRSYFVVSVGLDDPVEAGAAGAVFDGGVAVVDEELEGSADPSS